MIDFDQLLQLKAPLLIVLGLNCVMFILKRIPFVPDWLIPTFSFIGGGIAYPLFSSPGDVPFTSRCPLCVQTFFGLILGFAAVGGHQQVKQILNRLKISTGDTEVFTKDSAAPTTPETPKPNP